MAQLKEIDPQNIWIISEPEGTSAGIGDSLIPKKVDISSINKNLKLFTKQIGRIISDIGNLANYELSEISIMVNVSAEGKIQLLGVVGGKAQASGGITLKFSKK